MFSVFKEGGNLIRMKNNLTKSLVLITYMLLSIVSGLSQVNKIDEILFGDVDNITWSTYSVFLSNGKCQKNELKKQSIVFYNKSKHKIKYLRNINDSLKFTNTQYKWDHRGNLIEEQTLTNEGKIQYAVRYEYDSNGIDLIRFYKLSPQYVITDTEVFEYDIFNKLLIHSIYLGDMKLLLSRWEYDYEADGTRRGLGYDTYGKIKRKTISKYNDYNNIVFRASMSADGKIIPEKFVTYDDDQKKIEENEYKDGLLKGTTKWTYDKYGNCTDTYFYDKGGNLKRVYHYDYEYDSTGNWILRYKSLDDICISIIEREIEYY
jgi:hypothetical protein